MKKHQNTGKSHFNNWASQSRIAVARKLEYEKAQKEKEMLRNTSLKDLIK